MCLSTLRNLAPNFGRNDTDLVHLVLIGNTGSGKTTVAKALRDSLNIPYIGSGEIARELSESDPATDLALRAGGMAPEQAMRVGIKQRLEQADIEDGAWILDGFPRTVAQLACLMQWTAALPSFFYIPAEEWVCLERLNARKRVHDNPDSIATRLQHFEVETLPMVRTLIGGGVLHVVHDAGSRTVDEIVREIERALT